MADSPGLLPDWDSEVCILGAETVEGLIDEVRRLAAFLDSTDASTLRLADLAYTLNRALMGAGPDSRRRLALIASSAADLREKLDRAAKRLSAPNCRQIRDVSGIYYAAEPLGRGGKLAFLFPGEGAQYPNMLADLCLHFPEVRECFDQIDRVYSGHWRGYLPSDHIFPRASSATEEGGVDRRLWDIVGAVEAVLTANQALLIVLKRLGLAPDVILGHSTGEFSAVRAAGIFDPEDEDLSDFILKLYRNYEEASRSGVPKAVLLAVGSDRERVEAIAREVGGELYVAMDNCPHQVVLVGEKGAAERALAVVQREGLISEHLNFDRAYHTPLFAPYADHLRDVFENARVNPPRTTIYSCTTGTAYPDDPDAIRGLMVDHWLCPVEFRRTIETLHDEGVRLFVEVGPRGNLSAFVDDILRGRPFCTVPANVQRRSGLTQINHLVGILTAHGVDLDLEYLYRRRQTRVIPLAPAAQAEREAKPAPRMKLGTGFPAMKVSGEFAQRWHEAARAGAVPTPASAAAQPVEPVAPPPISVAPHPTPAVAVEPLTFAPEPAPIDEPAPFADEPESFDNDPAPIQLRGGEPGPSHFVGPTRYDSSEAGAAMVGDFLRTMDQFLVVQERVIRDCLGSGDDRAFRPTVPGGGLGPSDPGTFDGAGSDDASYPLLGRVISRVDGEGLVARRTIDPAVDLYLRDHTLGRDVSDSDPDLLAIPIMPLTMSLEMLAEAAAALLPGRLVVGLRDVRASRWLAFDAGPQEIELTARRLPGEAAVSVRLRNLTEDAGARIPHAAPVVEATVVLGDAYPGPMGYGARGPAGARASQLDPEVLYAEHMFHGPSWQGVRSIDATGEDGAIATLEVLPPVRFFEGGPGPRFVLDPVALDAAGQVVGFWTIEHLADGQVIFPYHLDALEIYGPPRPVGELVSCVASIGLVGDHQVRSDIDLFAADGRPWMRLVGWEDKRFNLPGEFHSLMRPSRWAISTEWAGATDQVREPDRFQCRRVAAKLPAEGGLWGRVWSSRVLGRGERDEFARLALPEGRRLGWLAGRTAAKEAVQALIWQHHGLDVPPADIEIVADHHGRMTAVGDWLAAVPAPPSVAICIADGLAVALARQPSGAGDEEGAFRLGVALGSLWTGAGGPAGSHPSSEERELLRGLDDRQVAEWTVRFRCAREAAGAALAGGLDEAHRSILVEDADLARGLVFVRLAGELAEDRPGFAAERLVVHTRRDDDRVLASTSCESEAAVRLAAN